MKSVTQLKCILLLGASICITSLLQLCHCDPFATSKGNITPVKLIHMHPGNVSSINRKEDSPFGSFAKISRIIPVKRFTTTNAKHVIRNVKGKVHHHDRHNSTVVKLMKPPLKFRQNLKPSVLKTAKKIGTSKILKSVSTTTSPGKTTTRASTTSRPSVTTTTTTKTSTSTFSTKRPLSSTISKKNGLNKNPLFISTESWNHLNSILKFSEIHEIINGLSYEVIQKASNIAKTDPKAAENYLLNIFFSEFGKMKRGRMLDLDEVENKVNTGVRYSAKRKPILNVIPIYNVDEGSSGKQGVKTSKPDSSSVNFRNVTGHMKNPTITSAETISTNSEEDNIKSSASSQSGSTASSLMHALVAPEFAHVNPTTSYSPYFSSISNDNDGFVPVFPMQNSIDYPTSLTIPFFSSPQPPKIQNSFADEIDLMLTPTSTLPSLIPRKVRGPPKEEEYQLPSLTTSSTPKPEEIKGYQTITEATTTGPKIVWYYHNQTPEDTFYPNSDNFLVPPEEASIEIPILKPVHEESSAKNPVSFSSPYSSSWPSSSSNDSTFKASTTTSFKDNKNERDFDLRTVSQNGNDGGVSSTGGGGRANRDPINNMPESDKKINKSLQLEKLGTTIVDHYPDDEYSHSSGRRKPIRHRDEESRRYYGSTSATYEGDVEKPYSSGKDDTASYIALNEYDHYRDSYPNKHEIRSSYKQSGRDAYYKERDESPLPPPRATRPYHRDSPTVDEYYTRRPSYTSDKYRDRERFRESSPSVHGGHHHDHYADHYGGHVESGHYHGHDGHGHGWKDPSKDFFSKAKDYFKHSDFSTAQKWFDVSIGILAFLAFGGYIIMLIYQVFTISAGTQVGTILGKSLKGAGEIFDSFFSSKSPIGQAYIDEVETIVKRAMANVKRIWLTNSFGDSKWSMKKVKGEVDAK